MVTLDTRVVAHALQAFVNTGTPREAIAVFRERSAVLLSDDALRLLDANLTRQGDDADAQAIFALRRRAIVAARERGVEAGVAELYRPEPQLQAVVASLVNASSYPEMVRLLRTTPALGTADAAECLDVLATWNAGSGAASQAIALARTLVDITRTSGVDDARRWLQRQLIDTIQSPGPGSGSVEDWESALQLTDAVTERVRHAEIRVNLGQAYRARGEAGDVDRAVAALERSLEVLTRADHSEHFSGVHRVLGNIFFDYPGLSPDIQCARAIDHYTLALETLAADADPGNFLHLHFMLASCWQVLNQPERARSHLRSGLDAANRAGLDQAIATCATLAGIMNGAGADADAALHEALATLSARVDDLPADAEANRRASLYDRLGGIYRELAGPRRSDDLERAIAASEAAAAIWTRAVDPDRWARMQHNLGVAYGNRVAQEKADNIEQAIHCYENALTVHTREAYPAYWALTHNALGVAWLDRHKGQREDNAEIAAQILEDALTVWDAERDPLYWGECSNALGAAHLRLVPRRGHAALDRAIDCFENARRVLTKDRFPSRWAQLQNNLANAYLQRNRPGDADQAIALIGEAVAATDPVTEGYLWATFKRNEGAAHSQIEGFNAESHLDAAIAALMEALTVFDADRYPAEHRETQAGLGTLWFRRGAWEEALAAFRGATAAAERVFERAYTETGRLSEAEELSSLYRQAAFCLVRLGRPAEALALHDRGKTRVLTDAIELSQARFDGLPTAQRTDAAAARDEIARLEDQMRLPAATPGRASDATLGRAIAQARDRLRRAIGRTPLAQSSPELLGLIPSDGALVVPILSARGGVAFVIPHGTGAICDAHVVPVALDADGANDLLIGEADRPGLLRAYADAMNAAMGADREAAGRAFQRYLATLEEVCGRLGTALMAPIFERLETYRLAPRAPVLLVPHSALTLLPLHAATAARGAPFLQRFAVQYCPSLAVMAKARARVAEPGLEAQLLAVADPGGNLEFAGIECAEITRLFGGSHARVLAGDAATVEAVMAGVGARSHLHFSCHGFHDWRDPLRSGVVLAGGRVLDVAEIMSPRVDLDAARLVVLSACETGLSEYARYPDEYVGLNFGLLLAGAPAVVSTMWAVEDRSTSLLMSEFYRRLRGGETAASALRHAQLWLAGLSLADLRGWVNEQNAFYRGAARDDSALEPIAAALEDWSAQLADVRQGPSVRRPYGHPYYWAAFTAVGAV